MALFERKRKFQSSRMVTHRCLLIRRLLNYAVSAFQLKLKIEFIRKKYRIKPHISTSHLAIDLTQNAKKSVLESNMNANIRTKPK